MSDKHLTPAKCKPLQQSYDVLGERVRQMLVGKTDKKVFVRSDNRLDVQTLIDVLDALKAGGVDDAGIVTDSQRVTDSRRR